MDARDARGQVTEHGDGHQRPVDRGPAFSFGLDLAAQNHISVFGGQAVLFEERRQLGTLHDGLDDRAVLTRADELGGGAVAEEQPERVDQDRLPRPGLARQERQPGTQVDLQAGNERDVVDSEQLKHNGRGPGQDSTPLQPGAIKEIRTKACPAAS